MLDRILNSILAAILTAGAVTFAVGMSAIISMLAKGL